MRLIIEAESGLTDLFKGLQLLTNAAEVKLACLTLDELNHDIIIPMKRRSYERQQFLLFGERYRLLSPEWIESKLIIRRVIMHKRKDNLRLPEIHILFGVKIKDKEIFLSSAEEQSGVPAFQMSIKVEKYDIELSDEGK